MGKNHWLQQLPDMVNNSYHTPSFLKSHNEIIVTSIFSHLIVNDNYTMRSIFSILA